MSKLPSIPSIPGNVDPQLYQVLSALKSNIDNLPTNTVTQTDLIKAVSSAPPGQAGPPGTNGDSYVLDITGGNTTIIYNEYGLNPLPHLAPFGYLFYKNGVSITTGLAFSWSITHPGNSLLSGISTSDTFIPAIAPTFDATKADNSVFLVVTHLGMNFTATEPISISAIGATGNGAAFFNITNSAATFLKGINNVITPASLTLATAYSNITPTAYLWSKSVNGGAFTTIAGATSDAYTITASTAYASATAISYKCTLTGTVNGDTGQIFSDVVTLPLLTDSKSVSTVVLSNENTTFPALVTGYSSIAFTGGNCDVTAYIGSTKLTPTAITALTATAYILVDNMELTAGNQEATYAVATATLTCTKPIREITFVAPIYDSIASATHGYALFDPVRYYYTGTALTGLAQNLDCYVIPITGDTFYLATRTAVAAGAFVVSSKYAIAAIGTTTQAQWNTIAGTTASTYAIGSVFTCANIGTAMGNGTAYPIPDITSAVVAGSTYKVTGNGWDSGGYSNTSFTGGAKLTFKVVGGNGAMIGLNTDPSFNNSYSSIDYCFYFTGGIVRIYESNTNPYTGGAWLPTDVFTILYNNDTVSYYQNNTCLNTVEAASGLTFYFDSSFLYSNTLSPNQITNLGFSAYVAVGANTFTYDTVSVGATVADGVINSVSKLVSIAAPTAMTTDTAYTDITISPRDAADNALASITKRISYSLSRRGSNYVAFITGGITNTFYDAYGSNPLPPQTAFSCELYENGSPVTPASYAWSVPSAGSLLTGSSSISTFTPTVAATFDSAKANNKVLLTVTFAGITVKAVQPIVMTQQAPIDATPPPAISGLVVRAGVLYNFLSWGTLLGNSDHVEIWRCATNNRDAAIPATKVGTSSFTIYADYIPEGVGTRYYYWIRAMSIAGVAGAWNAPAINGTYATPGGITDLQVSSLTASSIDVASLGALSANLGNITAGVMTSPTGRMLINLTAPQKIVIAASTATGGAWNPTRTAFKEGSYAGGHYIKIDEGQVTTYKWNGTAHESSSSLNTLEAGVCTSGATVVLTKYYATQPKVMVSPYKMQVYNQTYSEQNQTLTLNSVVSPHVSLKGHYSFVAQATLNIADDISGTTTVNNTVSNTTNQPITSVEYTTAPLSTTLYIVATVNSILGDGGTRFYERQVLVRVRYGTVTGVYPYATPLQTIDLGADNTANTVNLSFALGAAGTYKFVVEYTSADDPSNGTFDGGQPTWIPGATYTNTADADGALAEAGPVDGVSTQAVAGPTFPAFTPDTGFSVYQVDYTIAFGYALYGGDSMFSDAWITWPNGGYDGTEYIGTWDNPESSETAVVTTAAYTTAPASGITINATGRDTSTYLGSSGYFGAAQGKCFATGSVATIYTRKANTNSTTIANTFTLNSFYTNLSASASVIPGQLSWIAIG